VIPSIISIRPDRDPRGIHEDRNHRGKAGESKVRQDEGLREGEEVYDSRARISI
jgi:hypothetical protein